MVVMMMMVMMVPRWRRREQEGTSSGVVLRAHYLHAVHRHPLEQIRIARYRS